MHVFTNPNVLSKCHGQILPVQIAVISLSDAATSHLKDVEFPIFYYLHLFFFRDIFAVGKAFEVALKSNIFT